MGNVIRKNFTGNRKNNKLNLQQFETRKMYCPVSKEEKTCYYVPLSMIDSLSHNPGRTKGTQNDNVQTIAESFRTNPDGQEEPVCLRWSGTRGNCERVFGVHRCEAANIVQNEDDLRIANHPEDTSPGIWAWFFSGTEAEKTLIQMKENGNKKPQSPATKDEIATMLKKIIDQGGLDNQGSGTFASLDDESKRTRAKNFMKKEVPFWGGRRFTGVWNIVLASDTHSSYSSLKTWTKERIREYFAYHNKYGLPPGEVTDSASPSPYIDKDGTRYNIRFVADIQEMASALPANAAKTRLRKKVDKTIVVIGLGRTTLKKIERDREHFIKEARFWNENIYHSFDELYFVPQTKEETDACLLKGQYALEVDLTKTQEGVVNDA